MSYDVTAGGVWQNYTSNLSPFFEEFGVDIKSMHGQPGQLVSARIDVAVRKIVANPVADLDQFNPTNGWGSWPAALAFLMRIRDAAAADPTGTVDVS
jgi:hypothetical protein